MTAEPTQAPAPPELPGYRTLVDRLRVRADVDDAESALVDAAVDVWSRPGFDTFVSAGRLGFTPFDYQWRAAGTALRRMHGRAVLADEVGLGKTIEAGLVASELRARGLARRTLVLTPAGLLGQWREELDRKFALPSVIAESGTWDDGADEPVVLASLAAARRDPLRRTVLDTRWDLVIVDEAHRCTNPRSASAKLAKELRTRYLLLLTATPVQNRLDDLFHLVSLIAPGLLGTPKEFRARHGGAMTERPVRDAAGIQSRLREVMIRHRRSEVARMLPARVAETATVTPDAGEADLYDAVGDRVRAEAVDATSSTLLALRSVARLVGSSPSAAAPTLAKLGWSDLAESAAAIVTTAKLRALVGLLRRHVEVGEKVTVFTGYRATLDLLDRAVADADLGAVVYHGGLARRDKDAAIERFRSEAPVLLTTEAAGEGRNLQFCHVLVNFDLPWNPMAIEQRLGRLHRIGQEHEVLLINLVARGTIEERILHVLQTKINMFELVVGELDMILGRVGDDFDFESFVFSSYAHAEDDEGFRARLDQFGDELAAARSGYLDDRRRVDELVPDSEE